MYKVLLCLFFAASSLSAFSISAEEQIKIGALFSLSGYGAIAGEEDLNGARLAVEEINAQSGIKGKKILLVVEDNRSDLKATVTALKKLASVDKVQAVVGPNWAEFFGVAFPVANAEKVPLLSSSGTGDGILKRGTTHAFTLWPRYAVATASIVDYIKSKGFKKVAVILNENAFYQGVFDSIAAQFENSQNIFGKPYYFTPDQQDFRSVLQRIRNDGSEAVLALLLENSGLHPFFKQTRELNFTLPLLSGAGVTYDELLSKDLSLAEGLIFFDYFASGNEAFKAKYHDRYKTDAGQASAKAYDAVYLLKSVIERCGESRQEISRCLRTVDYTGVTGRIRFQEDGGIDSQEPNTRLYTIKNAKIVTLGE